MDEVAYLTSLAALTDQELVKEAENLIWLAAYASHNKLYDLKTDHIYKEAKKRGKPWLYARGYNQAALACNISLTEADRAAAREESYKE